MHIGGELAEYIHDTSFEDLSDSVSRYTKLCLFDWVGVTLGGSTEEAGMILFDAIREMGGKEQATILGSGVKTNVLFAALINGCFSHALDYDDTHVASSIHPSVCLAPAVVAVGEFMHVSGRELIVAFALGFEIATRVGAALGLSHYEHGWHATATVGRFGAAAGAAKLLGLNPDEIVNAFGLAGTQVGGLRQSFGTMGKPFHAGKAAMDGALAALLAKRGFESASEIFEGQFGIGSVYSDNPDLTKLTENLGVEYQILNVAFKPYAAALATHPAIEAILDIKEKESIDANDVSDVRVDVAKLLLNVISNENPKARLDCKFSTQHCAALAFVKGSVHQNMFTKEMAIDPDLVAFRKKVHLNADPEFNLFETRITVLTKDGRRFTRLITTPKGFPENPMSFEEMKSKFKGLSCPLLPREQGREIFYKIRKLEEVPDIGEVLALCFPLTRTSRNHRGLKS
ncbi:MmgE/PrpD family protein [delta proteobacterium NaphS2]|nr:MmgE/PrpD family protein [delta proteobacterium NaphS2]